MHRTLILATIAAALIIGGAAAAEKKAHPTHHYFWVTAPPAAVDNGCDQSQMADFLRDANLCSAAEQTLVPSIPRR